MVRSCVTCLSMVILFTAKGVCGQQWSVTYNPERTCGCVGGSVEMSCFYTYPSGLIFKQAYWTKQHYEDPPNLADHSNYRDRVTVYQCGAHGCQLQINSLTASDTGYYYCRITTHTGEKRTGRTGVYLDVKDVPQTTSVFICPPYNIYEGTTVTLTCSSRSDLPVQSYSWYKTDSQAALKQGKENTYTIHSIRTADTGNYYCIVNNGTDAMERSAHEELRVYSHPGIPEVVIGPPGQITEGIRVTLICSTGVNQPVHSYYRWYKRGGQSGENTFRQLRNTEKELTFSDIRSEDSGVYYCVATDRYGSKLSPYKQLHVLYRPKNTTIKSDPSCEITEGSNVTLTCMSEADPPVHTYTWIKKSGAVELKSGKEKTLTFSKIRSEDSEEYQCRAGNGIGQQTSSAVSIQVLYPPKNTTIIFSDPDVIVKGTSVTLTCSSDANPPVENYSWFKVNESTPVGSGQQYSITNITSEDGGQYYCEARNRLGSLVSNPVSIITEGDQSPFISAVVGLSVCGAVGLLCVLVWMSKRCRTAAVANRRDKQNDQTGNPDTQPDAVYQRLNTNTTQPDAVYQSLSPNTTQPDAVYQNLNTNTTQPDAVYQSLNPHTTQPDAVYQSLNTNTIKPDPLYQPLK